MQTSLYILRVFVQESNNGAIVLDGEGSANLLIHVSCREKNL